MTTQHVQLKRSPVQYVAFWSQGFAHVTQLPIERVVRTIGDCVNQRSARALLELVFAHESPPGTSQLQRRSRVGAWRIISHVRDSSRGNSSVLELETLKG